MEINWTLVSCFVIVFFAWSGFARGWWKEGLTTVALVVLVLFLQRPDLAQGFIDYLNQAITTVWNLLPNSLASFITEALTIGLGLETGGLAPQLDATEPGTWVLILGVLTTTAVLVSRRTLANPPDRLGGLLGMLLGGFNGFLILNLFREYLDGRSLPGGSPPDTSIVLAGSSAFGPPAQTISVQAVNLPNFTILDSGTPWILIGGGALLSLAVIYTRIRPESDPKKGRRINFKRLPPFYKTPPPRKETELKPLIKDIKKIFNE